jgi:hypothetical protein
MKSQELSYQKQLNRMELNLEKGRADIEVGSFLYRITILYSEICLIRISLGQIILKFFVFLITLEYNGYHFTWNKGDNCKKQFVLDSSRVCVNGVLKFVSFATFKILHGLQTKCMLFSLNFT